MSQRLATEQGKESAQEMLRIRRANNVNAKRIDNASLPAGSDMYFYCKTCGDVADVKTENYTTPVKKLCAECQALRDLDWLV